MRCGRAHITAAEAGALRFSRFLPKLVMEVLCFRTAVGIFVILDSWNNSYLYFSVFSFLLKLHCFRWHPKVTSFCFLDVVPLIISENIQQCTKLIIVSSLSFFYSIILQKIAYGIPPVIIFPKCQLLIGNKLIIKKKTNN